ncbi:hypothetical protein QYE76_014765 [Lolium multiflorum]|uniref:Uncharacterized protein n=1 Tax=Lolium multiflorum TaxID=4521 RepID=A0AAD8U5G8_LOLMU|nr:hypothetical protein QYE76_014765 [Lolium multiflorum]
MVFFAAVAVALMALSTVKGDDTLQLQCQRQLEESSLDACRQVVDHQLAIQLPFFHPRSLLLRSSEWRAGVRVQCCQQLRDVSPECRTAAIHQIVRQYEHQAVMPLGGGSYYLGEDVAPLGGESYYYPVCLSSMVVPGLLEEDWCCCGVVCLSSMTVLGVKIAKLVFGIRKKKAIRDQIRCQDRSTGSRTVRASATPGKTRSAPRPVNRAPDRTLRSTGRPNRAPGRPNRRTGRLYRATDRPGRCPGQPNRPHGGQVAAAAVLPPAVLSAPAVLTTDAVDSFPGDVFGIRCSRGKKSSAIFNDYLDIRLRIQRPASELHWYLHRLATVEEYQDWKRNMELGFNRCRIYNGKFSAYDAFVLAHRRVDAELDHWCCDAVERGDFACTWEEFKTFLRDDFVLPYMEISEKPPKVVHAIEEVGKSIVPIQEVGPAQTVTEGKVISSEEKEPGSDTMGTTVTMEDVPLSGLNMQLKKVQDGACKTVDKDDKPVLFGDKPDEATLVVDVDVASCATVPVCVDASIQIDDVCADSVSVQWRRCAWEEWEASASVETVGSGTTMLGVLQSSFPRHRGCIEARMDVSCIYVARALHIL